LGEISLTVRYKGNPKPEPYEMVIAGVLSSLYLLKSSALLIGVLNLFQGKGA